MKWLVTGREGQLARSLAERAAGHPEIALSFAGRPDHDLEQAESLAELIRATSPDVVVNAAAYTAVDRAEDDEARARQVNAQAPGVLAAAARDAGARFVQISTDYVFDGSGIGSGRRGLQ